jgi:D-alanine-D-alanine ligase
MNPTAIEALASATVAVLRGGRSSEREISLKSGAAVAAALATSADGRGPARVLDVEIRPDGAWIHAGEAHAAGDLVARLPRDTLFFLGLHGGPGEDGTIQGFLRASGRRHTGSGVGASALCMNKSWTRQVLREAGLCIAAGVEIHPHVWRADRDAVIARLSTLSETGFAVKPNRGGSSVSTFLVKTAEDLPAAIESVLATGDRALVEVRVPGSEATCGVLGNERSVLRALTPVEIVPHAGRFFDYEEKYSSSGALEYCPPKNLSRGTCARIKDFAARAHRAAGCDGYSRVDFMVPRDAHGRELEPVVLEINTLPGMTDRSLLPQAAAEEGLSFRDLCLEILGFALEIES